MSVAVSWIGKLVTFLLTEPWVIGLLAWTALLIGVPALWVAIAQLRKVEAASKASSAAIQSFKSVVREHDITIKLGQVVTSLLGCLNALDKRNFDLAVLHLDTAASALVDVREIGDEAHRASAGKSLISVRSERELLAVFPVGSNLTGRAISTAKRLRTTYGHVEEQLARSRLKFVKGR